MKKLAFILCVLFSLQISAQDFGGAILFNPSEVDEKYDKILVETLKKSYDKSKSIHTEYYTWDGKPESKPVSYDVYNDDTQGTIPIKTAIYLKTNFKFSEKLSHEFKVDTTGKVTDMWVSYPMSINPTYKIVDLPTSEVIESKTFPTTEFPSNIKYKIRNFSTYFGDKPNKLKKKAFDTAMAAFKKAELSKVDEKYLKAVKGYGAKIAGFSNTIKSIQDQKLYKPVSIKMNKKGKLDKVQIDASKSDYFSKGDHLVMYQKTKISDFELYDQVGHYAIVTDAEGENITIEPMLIGRKKMTQAVDSGNEIVFARNQSLIKDANRLDEPIKRVQVKGTCFLCNTTLEKLVIGLSTTKLIERNFEGPRKYFTDQYNNEKFIDFDMAALQDQQEGTDYIFDISNSDMKATEVSTGRIASSNQDQRKGFLGVKLSNKGPQMINLCMDIFGESLQVLEITKEKKGKVKRFMAYNPYGFENVYSYNMYVITEEKVGDRVLEREEHIGKCRVKDQKTNNFAEIKVNKGEKELYQALQANQKIKFKVKF